MRKGARQVCQAFERGKPCRPGSAIWTDGSAIYSYAVKIAWRDGGILVVNRNPERSSVTTRNHVNDVVAYFGAP